MGFKTKSRKGWIGLKQICDLHTHSVFSDGSYTPAQLIAMAEDIGLSAIALTDHNTVAGLPEFLAAATGKQIEAVAGVEFSTDYRGLDLHIVALDIPPEAFDRITRLMEAGVKAKEESNLTLVEELAKIGYPLDYPAIRDATPHGQVNRAHIAAAMMEKGYVRSVKSAFDTILDPKFGLYHPPKRPDPFEMIRFIKSIGATAVMAHPFSKLDEAQLREFLVPAKAAGLDAMETMHSSFDAPTMERAAEIAVEFGLLPSGGSDFHGKAKPDVQLGTGRDNLAVPLEFLRQLRERSQHPKREI